MEKEVIRQKAMYDTFKADNIINSFVRCLSKNNDSGGEIDNVFKSLTKRKAEYTIKDFMLIGALCRHTKAYCLIRRNCLIQNMGLGGDASQPEGTIFSYIQWYVKEESFYRLIEALEKYLGREIKGYEHDAILKALENFYFDINWGQMED